MSWINFLKLLHVFPFIMYEKKDGIEQFLRGYLYKNNQEQEVLSYTRYVSLQIGQYGYDDIATCKLGSIDCI